jgi:hypothetical protein
MQERDLIVGVLAAQAGFGTPSQVLTAASTSPAAAIALLVGARSPRRYPTP